MSNASVVALPGDVSAWPTLLDFLAEKFPHVARETWARRFQNGEICDATTTRSALSSEAPRAHAKLRYFRSVDDETHIPFEETIVFQDGHILVADKPHFLPVVPSGAYVNETLIVRLKNKTGITTLAPAHRIDRETAGLVLFTIRPETRGAYQGLFRDRNLEKTYEAIAPFREDLQWPMTYRSRLERSSTHFMQAQPVEGEPNAETRIELIERLTQNKALARYRLTPRTGARHQLRAQLAALGSPIVNDAIYPVLKPIARNDFTRPLQLLAKALSFIDPVTQKARRFESAKALDFGDQLKR